jgi:aspartyl-tRNA(Asn)/glutamyl-tRNA(Gln) amidotransferase subunit A
MSETTVSAGSGGVDVVGLTAWQCRELLSSGQVSACELTRAYLDRIAAVDGQVKAYLLVDEEGAMAAAAAVDARPLSERLPW